MNPEASSGPLSRIWKQRNPTGDPPVPQWMDDIWIAHGRPNVAGSETFEPEARALLFFVSDWYAKHKPYRFGLPAQLVKWLNASEINLTAAIQHRPALNGFRPCSQLKTVSRFMYSIWQQLGCAPSLEKVTGYYDFLAEFAFFTLPRLNAPSALLPPGMVELLNAPAGPEDVPLTVGMLLYIKRTLPDEYLHLSEHGRDRLLALSFYALEGLLATGDPRLIPSTVSGFWSLRPCSAGQVTAFEYVAFKAANNDTASAAGFDEAGIRNWFHKDTSLKNLNGLLLSGPAVDGASPVASAEQIQDRAILNYRDHQTVAGLSKAGASVTSALSQGGISHFDLHFSFDRHRLESEVERNRVVRINARRKLHILNLNPEYVMECCYCNFGRIGPSDYIVGQFAWELSRLSTIHEAGIAMVDEIWTGTRFLTSLYQTSTNKPVVTMGQVVSSRVVPTLEPAQFGFSEGTYLFLCSFDAGSVVERKNPLGTIIAFQNAFPRGSERVGLIIKTRNLDHLTTERDKVHWASAVALIRNDSRIRVVQYTMTDDELTGLYRMCGCFVSLHRSEGFGFGPAEALAQGRPAIATNYSGVCDFCTPETAKLVDYKMVRVQPDEFPFLDPDRIYHWADPDLHMASEHMRMLAEDREHGEKLGRAARDFMIREYSAEAVRGRYLARLGQLGFGTSTDPGA